MSNPLLHIKSTILGLIMLCVSIVYTFAPSEFAEITYEPNTWVLIALYGSACVLLLFEPNEAKRLLKALIGKWTR